MPIANSQCLSVLQKEGHNECFISIGRRNWLHLGSKEAGPKIAAIFSIVESCRKLDVPIRKYLADVLPGLADRSIQSLTELTPTAYAAKAAK
jgi:transposase